MKKEFLHSKGFGQFLTYEKTVVFIMNFIHRDNSKLKKKIFTLDELQKCRKCWFFFIAKRIILHQENFRWMNEWMSFRQTQKKLKKLLELFSNQGYVGRVYPSESARANKTYWKGNICKIQFSERRWNKTNFLQSENFLELILKPIQKLYDLFH